MNSINVSYLKRVTTGPYEHEEMSVQFAVDERSQLDQATSDIKEFVYKTLNKKTLLSDTTPTTTLVQPSQGESHGNSQESNEENSSKKSSKKSSSKSSKEEVTTTFSPDSTEEMEEVESPYAKSASESEPSKEEPKTKKASTKKAKTDEGIPYDCEKDEHKSTLTNFLTKLTGGKEWAKDKERSRKISREVLHGQPFLGKDGSILPSFSTICKTQYGVSQDVL